MIDICPQCHNHEWNKEITPDKQQITCPNCGYSWNFKAMPLFILAVHEVADYVEHWIDEKVKA